ncbi:hypothetical protein FIBSPDRAFT_934148 [Athelia psychrophila]|uniref:Uncharacterized protein n=1 Tax=Athelia psychrophila TaxID=1759441 RepID=A0A166FYW6_9AGAM|nr:hypothetical protein FIBSPDRAFT_934148 [Fibularhizoctonia sp. CBS 109695]
MPKRISTFEVIEDSEPEREERRRQGIGEGMASIKKRTGENAINAKTATSVLELSDDSYAGRPRVISTPIISNPMLVDTNSIVDISDPSPQTHPNGDYAEALPRFTLPPQHPLQPLSFSSPEKAAAQQVDEQIEEQHTYEYALDGDGDGDAFLHYDPILENPRTHIIQDQSLYHELPHTDLIGTHPSPATNQRVSKPRRSSSSSSEGPTARVTVKKSARSRGKQPAKKDKPLFNDVWEQELKNRILRDETLHLRILRYEPLHFDIFLAMVATDNKPSGILKLALRTFLDKQAINFYGADPSKRSR